MFSKPLENSLWVEKYRPQNLSEYVGNDTLKATIEKYIETNDIPHLLLHARAGTGKTSLGKIITNSIDCDVLYINASDENNIDTVRTKIKNFVSSVGFKRWKIVFLDEADALTPLSQAALRNMMEMFSKNARFIMTCNYPEKIIDPIQSRCAVFEVYPPSRKEVAVRLVQILNQEQVKYDTKDVGVIVNTSYPDIRRVINSAQRQTFNGALELSKREEIQIDYMNKVLGALKTAKRPEQTFNEIRQIIADSKVRTFDDMYRFLYDNVYEFAPENTRASVIVEIAKAMRDDSFCIDKEINIMAMFIAILGLISK